MLALAEELPDPLELEEPLADALWLDVSDPVAAPLGVLLPVGVRLAVILADLVLLPVADAVDGRDPVGVLVAAAVGVRVPLWEEVVDTVLVGDLVDDFVPDVEPVEDRVKLDDPVDDIVLEGRGKQHKNARVTPRCPPLPPTPTSSAS